MKKLFYILSCSFAVLLTSCEDSGPSNSSVSGSSNGHDYVDLGLSVRWATCNVGADSPEEYGDYFAWGETQPKSEYNWRGYKWCEGSDNTLTKYCTEDNKTILELSDDAANANWGGSWRMPTKAERDELYAECTWILTNQKGVIGYTVIGPNGNGIFLPAAGYRDNSDLDDVASCGYYWSSSLDVYYSYHAYQLYFLSYGVYSDSYNRHRGQSVRPVLP